MCLQKRAEFSAEEIRDRSLRYIRRNKAIVAEARARGCRCCDETEIACLDFHHRDRDEKSFNVMEMLTRSEQMLRDEIAKCDVLCANCHRKVHAGIIDLDDYPEQASIDDPW